MFPQVKAVQLVLATKMLGEQKMNPITVDGGKGTVELGDQGVLHLVWKRGTVLEAADVHAAMAMVNELADGAEYPMLIDISETQAVTRQARSVFSVKCAASRIALLGSSPINRIIANFAMARRTLPCPTRFSPPAMRPCPGFSRRAFPDTDRGFLRVRGAVVGCAERWAVWVAPIPLPRAESKASSKRRRQVVARMQQPTRSLTPLLPAFMRSAKPDCCSSPAVLPYQPRQDLRTTAGEVPVSRLRG
jgi:hypothetical protein